MDETFRKECLLQNQIDYEIRKTMYIKYEKDLIAHIRSIEGEDVSKDSLTDESLLNDYYEAEYYYYTEWDDKDDFQYEITNGTLTLIQD